MDIKNMRNMVVLKNLPSNLIEEAFVVLKDNVKIHKEELVANKKSDKKEIDKAKDKDYVIKEAEMIVTQYIQDVEKKQYKTTKEKIRLEEKCRKLKYSTIFFAMFSAFSVISLLLK